MMSDGGTGGTQSTGHYAYSACPLEDSVGGFTIELTDQYTSVTGKVTNGVVPTNIPDPLTTMGACTLVQGRSLFCDPACASDQTCDENGMCIPYPVGQDLGEVTIAGLKDPVSMTARSPAFNYNFTGMLQNPGLDEGDRVTLSAAGGTGDAFTLVAEGIAPLMVHESELALEDGQPATMTWDPPAQGGRSRLLATLNISLHGGNPVRIECDFDDTGSLEIPADLISELLGYGYSGFPAITLVRQTSDSLDHSLGCVDFRVISTANRLPVVIAGLTSCTTNDECPMGQTCQEDLTCQ